MSVQSQLFVCLLLSCAWQGTESFVQSTLVSFQTAPSVATPFVRFRLASSRRYNALFDDDDMSEDEDDEDLIDPDSLGDWRAFRQKLQAADDSGTSADGKSEPKSPENEEILLLQNERLAQEYKQGIWAHPTDIPQVGGLVVRMSLEAELYRNHKHSVMGKKLRQRLKLATPDEPVEPHLWYTRAQTLVEDQMQAIAQAADPSGQIDAATLQDDHAEMLQLYLDHQENWQEVCLVLRRDTERGTATTLVLNRPMALKLTENLARLVLHGTSAVTNQQAIHRDREQRFLKAFGNEVGVYVGGPDDQHLAAIMLHSIPDLPGATEIAPGTDIYEGGVDAAMEGVLNGTYKPLDFRFFVGSHEYHDHDLDVSVLLGKHQPVACARAIPLKQCIALPKPLWHEVLEFCGGELKQISKLEMEKRSDLRIQIIDEEDLIEDDLDGLFLGDDLEDDEEEFFA